MWGHPYMELEFLRGRTIFDKDEKMAVRLGKDPVLLMKDVDGAQVRWKFAVSEVNDVRVNLRGKEVIYDGAKKEVRCGKLAVPVIPLKGTVTLDALIDRGSVEVFVNEGMAILSVAHIAPEGETSVTATGEGTIEAVSWWRVKSAWK